MSKKIMKRSLALGALMAFVITGSAFAETHYIIGQDGSVKQGSVSSASTGKYDYTALDINGWNDFKDVEVFGEIYYPGSVKLEKDETKGKIAFSGNIATSTNPAYADTDLNGMKLTVIYKGEEVEKSSAAISAKAGYNTFKNDKIYVEGKDGSYAWHQLSVENLGKDLSLEIPGFNIRNGNLEVDSDAIGIDGYGTIDVGTLKITSVNNAIQSKLGSKQANNDNHLAIDINAENIELYVGANGNAIQVENTLEIDSNVLNITNIKDSYYGRAIRVSKAVTANINADVMNISGATGSSKVTGEGTLNLSADAGDIVSNFEAGEDGDSKGTVKLTLGSGVTLTGSVVTDTDSESASNITLNGATWDVQGNSNVTTLAGENGNVVINDTEHKIEIGNNANSGLKLKASKALSEDIVAGNKKLEDIAANFDIQGGTKEVTLATQETDIAGESSITYNTETNKTTSAVVKQVSAKNDAISNAGMALKGHYRAHMNDMNKRMGELRMANGEAGVWTRMVRGESEYQDAKMQYNQYQLGYDEKLSVDKRWTVGAAVTFAEGDSSYGYGSTEDKSTAFAIYGSKLNNDGTFVDLIARYARLESDIDDVQSGKGDYSTNGMSVSAEFGKRIQQGNGMWIEPQVELTYGTVDSADFRLDGTNKDIHVDSMDSFIARVGFSMGKDIKQGNVYARASYLYDFDGETETSFSANGVQGDVVKEDFGGGWWEVGVGANINLSKATYIYADVEKTFGGEVDTNWQWNLGVRYSF